MNHVLDYLGIICLVALAIVTANCLYRELVAEKRRQANQIAPGLILGANLCRVFGLGDKRVTDLKIHTPLAGVTTITAEMLVTTEQAERYVKVLKDFELKDKSEQLK